MIHGKSSSSFSFSFGLSGILDFEIARNLFRLYLSHDHNVVFNVILTVSDPPINQRNSLALLSCNILAL